jgi:hypothetical protein
MTQKIPNADALFPPTPTVEKVVLMRLRGKRMKI